MKRRTFILGLGGAAASSVSWPLTARAQSMPVIGYLGATSRGKDDRALAAFGQGLKQAGFVEGQNVAIEYRWADGQYDRLPALATELAGRQVAVIFAPASTPAALAAKAATATIPIVFTIGSDPVAAGLVASLARPGGNVTGVSILVNQLSAKRLELFKSILPNATVIAVLMNPSSPNAWPDLSETQAAALALGLQLIVVKASTASEIDAAFAGLAQQRPAGVFLLADGFFRNQHEQLTALASRHAMPASYPYREFAEAGGLMSYGANIADSWRQAGFYVGRVLRGEKSADLPVMQATKLELVINLKTAKALGLEVTALLLATADEVIE
jgi:putative ABC transport system substrate-binding protein